MRRLQSGSAMVEGLTAVTVFSIGILGVIGLQASVLENNAQAQFRAEASYLAEEVIGLATADAANAACYSMNPGSPDCTNAFAQEAAQEWAERVQASLPGADEILPQVAYAADGTFTVTIQWKRQSDETWNNYVSTTNISGS
jgi:type IV pilus assembly protein PilV